MTEDRLSWERYALKLASVAAERSEDPFMQVGACALGHDHSVIGLGYNGAPPGITINWNVRDERRLRVVHAEVNALRYTSPGECKLLAVTHVPCNECLRLIAAYKIKNVVFNDVYSRDMSSLDIASDFNINLTCTPYAIRSVSREYKNKFTIIDDI